MDFKRLLFILNVMVNILLLLL